MVNNIINFNERRFHRLAVDFYDLYTAHNPVLAAKYLLENVPKDEDRQQLQEYVKRVFVKNGWTWPDEYNLAEDLNNINGNDNDNE